MGDVADGPGLAAGQGLGPGSVELLVDPLLFRRLTQLLVFRDGHDHRHHLAAVVDHVMGVTGGQFAHEGHGNDTGRQPGTATGPIDKVPHRGGYGRSMSVTPGKREQAAVRALAFQPGQRRAEVVVDAVAERQIPVGIAPEIDLAWAV